MEIFNLFMVFLIVSLTIYQKIFAADPLSEALLNLKSELKDESNSLKNWVLATNKNPSQKIQSCSWSGIKCDKNSTIITSLDLSMKNLAGVLSGSQFSLFIDLVELNLSYNSFSEKFPSGVFDLRNLQALDISRNNFSGEFPNGISTLSNLVVFDAFSNSFSGGLPVDVAKIETLKVLNLAGSYFSGSIPSDYGSFKNLESMHLAGNSLTGKIPKELGQLQTLTRMEIGYNKYEGIIPFELGNMSAIRYLDIAGANLSGFVPKELSNLTKLESLFLFRNQLTGSIPDEFGTISTLTDLDLSDNLLTGPIPESFSELKRLKLLSLMYNHMTGTIPRRVAELPSLETLLIWNNMFYGEVPETLGKFSNLKWVDVSTNNFVGMIPRDICSRGSLAKLILFSNNFTDGLSPSLSNCSSLVRLRLENNSFSGDISLNFRNLPDISYIDLSTNMFSGGIPVDISRASNLLYLNVSNNPELGGIVPIQTWSSPLLQNFSASSCSIQGNLSQFESCKSLSVIELSSNKISGTVSESISNCKVLERIDLSFNDLSGHLPEELASLPDLAILDVSHNHFNGLIPLNFANSSSLHLLNVSYNNFSGSIPSENRFYAMGSSAFAGNAKLCGEPLQPCSSKSSQEPHLGNKRKQNFTWVFVLCTLVVTLAAASVLSVFYFRRMSESQWKMVTFPGLPKFSAIDVLRSLNSTKAIGEMQLFPKSVCKAILPTGITVSVKRVDVDSKNMGLISEFVTQLGNTRHKNLARLLGFCYNKKVAYILYDYLPNGNLGDKMKMKRDWDTKYNMVIEIANGLRFLHHECYPAIPHGELKANNVAFDEKMEPLLAEFGFKFLQILEKGPFTAADIRTGTGEYNQAVKEELEMDIYNFGELILEILTNGRITNVGEMSDGKPKEALLREIYHENEARSSKKLRDEIKLVLDVSLSCMRYKPCDRPSIEDILKLLTSPKPSDK